MKGEALCMPIPIIMTFYADCWLLYIVNLGETWRNSLGWAFILKSQIYSHDSSSITSLNQNTLSASKHFSRAGERYILITKELILNLLSEIPKSSASVNDTLWSHCTKFTNCYLCVYYQFVCSLLGIHYLLLIDHKKRRFFRRSVAVRIRSVWAIFISR